VIEAEQRLLDAGRAVDATTVDPNVAAGVAAQELPGRDHPLSAEQADAVRRITTSGRSLDVLVGPAGTGKSTTMAGSAPSGKRSSGRARWSGWPRPRPPRRCSPTPSVSPPRTRPNGSPRQDLTEVRDELKLEAVARGWEVD
jgi:hypothetical protein